MELKDFRNLQSQLQIINAVTDFNITEQLNIFKNTNYERN